MMGSGRAGVVRPNLRTTTEVAETGSGLSPNVKGMHKMIRTIFAVLGGWAIVGVLVVLTMCCLPVLASPRQGVQEPVGVAGKNRIVLPVTQTITPSGRQVELPGLRPQSLALSPDGRLLITSGKTSELVVLDPTSGAIRQRLKLPSDLKPSRPPSPNILEPPKDGQLSYTGLIFSHAGTRIYLSNVNGSVEIFSVSKEGTVSGVGSFNLPPARAPRREEEIPAGLALSADDLKLYVAFNLGNSVGEFEAETGKLLRRFEVGVAPYDLALLGTKLYVSNWGGRRPHPGDAVGPAGRGTEVKIDPVTGAASEGSVTVLDLESGTARSEILVQLHASALALSPDRGFLVCANAASDNLSVIDTRTDRVVKTIWVKPSPSDLFGASPNALAFDQKGRYLYVANGTQNAVAVIRFDPSGPESRLEGLIPVGWFPGAVVYHTRLKPLCVANIKGIGTNKSGPTRRAAAADSTRTSITAPSRWCSLPAKKNCHDCSATVMNNYRREQMARRCCRRARTNRRGRCPSAWASRASSSTSSISSRRTAPTTRCWAT